MVEGHLSFASVRRAGAIHDVISEGPEPPLATRGICLHHGPPRRVAAGCMRRMGNCITVSLTA